MATRALQRKIFKPANVKFISTNEFLNSSLNPELESFRTKSFGQLARGFFVLKLSTHENFVKNAEKLYGLGQKVLGRKLCDKFLKSTFYGQFVAGDSQDELENASLQLLKDGNVKTMLCPPMEDLHGTNETFAEMAKSNTEKYLDYLKMAQNLNRQHPGRATVLQYKPSATFPIECFDKYSEAIEKSGKGLHYHTEVILDAIQSNNYSKVCENLDKNTSINLKNGFVYCKEMFKTAQSFNIPIIVDAELRSSYNAMVAFCLAFSVVHNGYDKQPLIFITYQNYLKDATNYLNTSLEFCQKHKVCLGAKLVRGAYMLMERDLANKHGYEDPVWSTYEQTSATYNNNVAMLLSKIKSNQKSVSLYIASHNEDTVKKAKQKLHDLRIPKNSESVKFAQIYGMCDHISFGLGKSDYVVYKSIPWGSVDEWVPYLSRRASENYTAFQTARNEIPFYKNELKRRLKLSS